MATCWPMCGASVASHVSSVSGAVDSQLRPILWIALADADLSFPVWIDLGFDAELVISRSEAARLDVANTGRVVDVLLGDGVPSTMPIGTLRVQWLGRDITVSVLLSEDTDPSREERTGRPLGLLGLGLLRGARVQMDIVLGGKVVIERPIPLAAL